MLRGVIGKRSGHPPYRTFGSAPIHSNRSVPRGKQGLEDGPTAILEAKKHGQRMPVIFASADVTDKLLYYAVLSNLVIDEASSTTSYQFNHLQPVKGDFLLSSLRLRSTNRPLSDNYIRPYAICHTPSFIR